MDCLLAFIAVNKKSGHAAISFNDNLAAIKPNIAKIAKSETINTFILRGT
jgi:hypothetical protein